MLGRLFESCGVARDRTWHTAQRCAEYEAGVRTSWLVGVKGEGV
jgi:hypothetical protein